MARYRLSDEGLPYRKIISGGKWVGRTYRDAQGRFRCIINKQDVGVSCASHEDAFHEGVSRHLGFASAADLDSHNRAVRSNRRARSQRARALADAFVNADTVGKIQILDKLFGGK